MRHKSVLLVDDDPDQLELSTMALQEVCTPAQIATTSTPEQALGALIGACEDTRMDLVLLDFHLGPASGLDVLRAFKARGLASRLTVVVFSSSPRTQDVTAALAEGAAGFLQKPRDLAERSKLLCALVRNGTAALHMSRFWFAPQDARHALLRRGYRNAEPLAS